jgi:perosamine synthetase
MREHPMIPVYKPYSDDKEPKYLKEVIDSGIWSLGPKTAEFESRFAAFVGTTYALGLNSVAAALELALRCLDLQGGEVILPSLSFVAVSHAVLHSGGTPVFCDIEPENLNITAENIAALVTPRTRAVIVSHYAGYAADLDPIMELAQKHNLVVIEDCSQACGGKYREKMLGSIGHMACFSFQVSSNLTTGEGGMLVTNNEQWAAQVKKLRYLGIAGDITERGTGSSLDWQYEVSGTGYKFHMHDISAALGMAQLEKIDWMNARRRNITEQYKEAFSTVPQLKWLPIRDYMFPACCLFVIRTKRRDELRAHLHVNGIASALHYYPSHLYPMYKQYSRPLPVTESVWQELLTLPLYAGMTEDQFRSIVRSVWGFYKV